MWTSSFFGPALRVTIGAFILAIPTVGSAELGDLFRSGPDNWVTLSGHGNTPHHCWGPVDCTPEMFGDAFISLLDINTDNDGISSAATVPFPGGSDRMVIARNNSALVRNRFYATYDHTTGAYSAFSVAATDGSASLDRIVLGLEKVFLDGQASLEIRLPFAAERDFTFDRFSIQNDSTFGNLGLIGKLQLIKTENKVVSGGVGVQLPTGGDINGEFDGNAFNIENDAVMVSPFLAFAAVPKPDWFYQGFAQVDFFASPNTLTGLGQSADFDSQSLLRLSAGGGKWFFRKNHGLIRGMAGITELHYTSTLEDSDSVTFTALAGLQRFSNTSNRQDVLNLTSGLHLELSGNANARVGVSVPLRGEQRFYDSTLMVQVNIGL